MSTHKEQPSVNHMVLCQKDALPAMSACWHRCAVKTILDISALQGTSGNSLFIVLLTGIPSTVRVAYFPTFTRDVSACVLLTSWLMNAEGIRLINGEAVLLIILENAVFFAQGEMKQSIQDVCDEYRTALRFCEACEQAKTPK